MRHSVFILLILLSACHTREPKPEPETFSDLKPIQAPANIAVPDTVKEKEVHDSIILDREMDMVLKYANAHPDVNGYDRWIDTSVTHDPAHQAHYRFGNLFSNDRKHLLVLRYNGTSFDTDVYLDLLLMEKGRFRKLISDTLLYGGYRDTLRDLNGDGYADLVLATYSSAGCCPREDETGFIYLPATGRFSVESFFNPEYFPAEKLVYEMDYGHPGEVALLKYRWTGTQRELVETIAPTMEGDHVFKIRKPYTFTRILYPKQTKQVITNVPPDFKRLGDFEYFISYQD